jgi:alpha-D-xyloside xylohydrolase
MSLPLYARPNSVIPIGADDSRPDYDLANNVTFHVFKPEDGACILSKVPTSNGQPASTLEISRNGQELSLKPGSGAAPWQVLLRNIPEIASCEGGDQEECALGLLITPESPEADVRLKLHSE